MNNISGTLTTKLRNGVTVLAKQVTKGEWAGEIYAMTYANFTQAKKATAKHGGEVRCYGRPFYVCFPDVSPIASYVAEGLGENVDFCPSDNS